jgi:1,4-dihydroxy-2-naphthoyl-CoA hydrolase
MSDVDRSQRPAVEGSPETMGSTLGIGGFETVDEGSARARLPVSARVLQPYGIVHGGAYATLAESVASWATWQVVGPELGAFGQSNDTSFLRPVSRGTIRAEARARHRGRTTWVWDVEMLDDEGRLCALSRVTVAVRPLRRD